MRRSPSRVSARSRSMSSCPRDARMRFVCALNSILGLAAVFGQSLDHHIDAARDVATGGGAHGHRLADMKFVEHGVLAPASFDHLVGAREQCGRHFKAEHLSSSRRKKLLSQPRDHAVSAAPISTTTRRMPPACCAPAASGHAAAAPPSRVMSVRLLTRSPRRPGRAACRELAGEAPSLCRD
jgi:hypothetical protein